MVRPGPKTRLEDVKTAIMQLLREDPDGINFNEIFRRLKDQKALGSFSVLDRAMKDLRKSKVVFYREVKKPRYKIPMRIYALAPKTQSILEKYQAESSVEAVTPEKATRLEELSMDLFEELKIENPSEAAFLTLLLRYARQLTFVYEQILEENGDPKGFWRLLLNDLLRSQRNYMKTRAEWARSRKILKTERQKLANHTKEVIWRLITMLTVHGISLKAKELTE
jgi:hypothetical protein